MSSSKFLPFQDVDGDGLNDVCKDEVRVEEGKVCPECTPNPYATVPNWRVRKNFAPFLNEKVCKYQTTYTTPLSTTGYTDGMTEDQTKQALDDIYAEYQERAIEILLTSYGKDVSEGSIELIKAYVEYTDYDLDPKPGSRLKLLYSVPFENINALPEATPDEDDGEASPIEVTYLASELGQLLLQARKGLSLYSRYLKAYRYTESRNVLYVSDDRVFNLEDYGDGGFGDSIMRDLGLQLSEFFRSNGYNIEGLAGALAPDLFPSFYGFSGSDTVTEITFGFTEEYRLQKIIFYTEGCSTKPIVFAEKCEQLRQEEAWKDKTAVAYFTKLNEISNDLLAREPRPWIDFLVDHTYPTVYATEAIFPPGGTSCVASALAAEGKQLGQDILDEVFGLGDAIAYKFREAYCKATNLDAVEEKKRLGLELVRATIPESVVSDDVLLSQDVDKLIEAGATLQEGIGGREISNQTIDELIATEDPAILFSDFQGNAYGIALEQAFGELTTSQSPFASLCSLMLSLGDGGSDDSALSRLASCVAEGEEGKGATYEFEKNLFDFSLDDLLKCGLFNIVTETINCLLGGLTFEAALSRIIQSALQGMSITNFGELFVGLPADKQQEMDALVKKKLAEGDIFNNESPAQEYSDQVAANVEQDSDQTLYRPWNYTREERQALRETYSASERASEYFNLQVQGDNYESAPTSRTLVQSFDSAADNDSNTTALMAAYIDALIEVYANDLLTIVDELGRFPGAPIISEIIVALDCPKPPIFQPGIPDFIKDIDLPFCRGIDPLVFPKFRNPFDWIPKISDILRILFKTILCQLQLSIIKIISKIIVKLCELIGSAICNALEVVGDVIGSLPDLVTGRTNLSNAIRESICGDDASDEQVQQTIVDIVAQLGVGGAAFADTEKAISFMEDLSASMTYEEMTQALLGEPPQSALDIIDGIIEYDYPEYRDSIPNTNSAGRFFKNIGNLMPASFRSTLRDSLESADIDATLPANPSICLDPQRLQTFDDLRCSLLEGRASPEQCKEMFCSMRDQMLDDLGDLTPLTDIDNLPDYLASQLPPAVSDPGCENGLFPYEPQTTTDAIAGSLGADLEQLKVDYSTDMLGNGPGKKNWGLMNMMLSDTMGTPLSTHVRKVANQRRYVDYYSEYNTEKVVDAQFITDDDGNPGNPFFAMEAADIGMHRQRGAYPTKVAAYLQDEMSNASTAISVSLSNDAQDDISTVVPISQLQLSAGRDFNLFTSDTIDLLEIPDLGYDISVETNLDADGDIESLTFIENARKATADLLLEYKDNAKGLRALEDSEYAYGFNIGVYFSDLYKTEEGQITNIFSDNMRLRITQLNNLNAHKDAKKDGFSTLQVDGINENGELEDDAKEVFKKFDYKGDDIIEDLEFEFLAVDDTLQSITPADQPLEDYFAAYPEFLDCFTTKKQKAPQTYLFKEIINKVNNSEIDLSSVEAFQNTMYQNVLSKVLSDIADTEAPMSSSAWNFGAQYDGLSVEDLQYGINTGTEFLLYSETEYENKDMILGISRDQYNNEVAGTPENTRVYYLDPASFGGNYKKPPLYIKPVKQMGWLGLVEAFFPELGACKPQTTDLVDFEEIQDFISEIYSSIPEDDRLKQDSDCVIELPYNRVLTRNAKAGIFGLIKAAIRIYVSVHFIKALPTFTKFSPKFPQVFSSAYASFIVEDMQASFLDAQGGDGDYFQTFKDNEFWYGFLEQCVQTYSYLVDEGKIDPPATVLEALIRLNDMQEEYDYPDLEDFKAAEDSGETDRALFNELGLLRYREEKNFEAIKATEEDAKLVMKEMVIQELNYMAKIFMNNLRKLNLTPDIKDTRYYVLETLTQGGSNLTLNSALNFDGTFKATNGDLPTVPWEDNDEAGEDFYYTSGGELVVEEDRDQSGFTEGQEYIGYYHVHIDEETGYPVYMAGEVHSDEPHDLLKPLANIVKVQIGDIDPIDQVSFSDVNEKPFVVEKYVKIKNVLYTPDRATEIINSNENLDQLISDVYPGNMKLVLSDGEPVGVEGELGVRYGLRFSVIIEGQRYELTSVEIDALDTSLRDFTNLTADSKLLLCLVNHLVEDEVFNLMIRYILPLPKLLSIAAIYNDKGMLPSIGEITVEKGKTYSYLGVSFENEGKPGVQAYTDENGVLQVGPISKLDDLIATTEVVATAPDGAWAHVDDRNRFTPFFLEWDDWDQVLLRNSTSRVKKLFKSYYYSKDYKDGKSLFEYLKELRLLPGALAFQRLKAAIKPLTTGRLVPWWMKRRLRTNPFNANDQMCKKDDL